MPRAARKKSSTGIYHVMLRGINQQIIFEDYKDYRYFLDTLISIQKKSNFILYAYCLMDNHVHLLIAEKDEPLKTIFRRICDKYVYYYNHKYNRTGHLFQDRFRSENVDDVRYFLTACRYILQNPMSAGLVTDLVSYPWTNYIEFLNNQDDICDVNTIINMFNTHEECITFLNTINKDKCIDIEDKGYKYISDEDGIALIKNITHCENISEIQHIPAKERNYYLREFRAAGLSIRQISRLTGISKTVIGRV